MVIHTLSYQKESTASFSVISLQKPSDDSGQQKRSDVSSISTSSLSFETLEKADNSLASKSMDVVNKLKSLKISESTTKNENKLESSDEDKIFGRDSSQSPCADIPSDKVKAGGFRKKMKIIYDGSTVQTSIFLIICVNGFLYIVQTTNWTDNCCCDNLEVHGIINQIDQGFLIFYTVEIVINFYVHFFKEFWRSGWNIFDLIVIAASWIPMDQNMAAMRMSRLLRTFRLVRIGDRIQSFEFIIETLKNSLTGVSTLMILLAGLMTIYAVLGVALFGEHSEYFSDFVVAAWTLFVTVNGENWPDIAGPIIDQFWFATLYFGSFIIFGAMLIMNMIVAVFIQEMGRNISKKDNSQSSYTRESIENELRQSSTERKQKLVTMMSKKISNKQHEFINQQFDKMDVDGNGYMDLEQLTSYYFKYGKEGISLETARQKVHDIISHMDKDGDMLIDREEWKEAHVMAIYRRKIRGRVRAFIDSDRTQKAVSTLILLNGVLYIIESGKWSPGCCIHNEGVRDAINIVDYGFLAVFTVELALNFWSHTICEFFSVKWNIFDLVIIAVSWIPTGNNVTAFRLSRLIRTFRLLRVGGRIEPILIVLSTLYGSISDIGALLSLLLGVMTIYAILGVGLFEEYSDQFKSFPDAFWTLFVTLNGETWPVYTEELLARDCWYGAVYFGSFISITVVVCMNMIVAVFIDKTNASIQRKLTQRETIYDLQTETINVSPSEIRKLLKEPTKPQNIWHASANGHLSEVSERLRRNPKLVNAKGYDDRTPLHLAASGGHDKVVRKLLCFKADVTATDRWNKTAHQSALESNQTLCALIIANVSMDKAWNEAGQLSEAREETSSEVDSCRSDKGDLEKSRQDDSVKEIYEHYSTSSSEELSSFLARSGCQASVYLLDSKTLLPKTWLTPHDQTTPTLEFKMLEKDTIHLEKLKV